MQQLDLQELFKFYGIASSDKELDGIRRKSNMNNGELVEQVGRYDAFMVKNLPCIVTK